MNYLLSKEKILDFENEQKHLGTEVALYNFVWKIASGLMKTIGVKSIQTQCSEKHKNRDGLLRGEGL